MRKLLLALLIVPCLFAAGCGAKKAEGLGENIIVTAGGAEQKVSGYNEPVQWQNKIGVRAVARDRLLMISVHNKSDQPIFVEPRGFRMILPGTRELYEFKPDREELSGFVPRELKPGEYDLFTAGISQQAGDLEGNALIFNYPPAEVILRVPIETVTVGD